MAVSDTLLFVASPQSGDVNILEIDSRKVIAVVPVGTDPGAVVGHAGQSLRAGIESQVGRRRRAARLDRRLPNGSNGRLLTLIPVGERPVSAAVRGV